jgi:hypothetical protein
MRVLASQSSSGERFLTAGGFCVGWSAATGSRPALEDSGGHLRGLAAWLKVTLAVALERLAAIGSHHEKPIFTGAPGEIRTPDHLVRSQVLYPAELRAQAVSVTHSETHSGGHGRRTAGTIAVRLSRGGKTPAICLAVPVKSW